MKAELRADGLHISGYVNVPGRTSRPVVTPRGKVIEVIEQGAFARAIARAGEIRMLLDHDRNKILANTGDDTLSVKEDTIGLKADSIVTDEDVLEGAKKGLLRGWSFNMKNVVDSIEERENDLPIRHVKDFDMDEITLVMNKTPVYSSTSVEVRADSEEDVEVRAIDLETTYSELAVAKKEEYDNSDFRKRIENLGI